MLSKTYQSSLVIGGTGMLTSATLWLAAQSGSTIIIARHATRFAKESQHLIRINADWNSSSFPSILSNAINSVPTVAQVLLWLHEPEKVLSEIIPIVGKSRIVLVLGSLDGNLVIPIEAADIVTVRLGSMPTGQGRPRGVDSSGLCEKLVSGPVVDYQAASIGTLIKKATNGATLDNRRAATALFYAVRDDIFYEIFGTDMNESGLQASTIARTKRGFCLHKAILYTTVCRAIGVPALLVAARVLNHISSPNIQKLAGGDVFLHWYNEIFLGNEWIKVSPIFNKLLRKIYSIALLEFDGYNPAIHQASDSRRTMEFLEEPKRFGNPTAGQLIEYVRLHHPRMITQSGRVPSEIQISVQP